MTVMFEHGIDFLFNETSLYTKEKFKVFEIKDNKYEYDKDEFFRFLFYKMCIRDRYATFSNSSSDIILGIFPGISRPL